MIVGAEFGAPGVHRHDDHGAGDVDRGSADEEIERGGIALRPEQQCQREREDGGPDQDPKAPAPEAQGRVVGKIADRRVGHGVQ